MAAFEALGIAGHSSRAGGLLADMDFVADVLFNRVAKHAAAL